MKILLVCMEFGYGIEDRGRSYEYFNFYDYLKDEHNVQLFDYMAKMKVLGKQSMNEALIKVAESGEYDVAIFSLYTDQILPSTVEKVRDFCKTLSFFHDDTWRREFVRSWAPYFDNFTSTDPNCKVKYEALGLPNVLFFPFGANPKLYRPLKLPIQYDVSFVGGWHPRREWIITKLRRSGINVKVAGHGWPGGIVEHGQMVEIFNKSRINLNLSNSRSWDARLLLRSPVSGLRQLRSKKVYEQLKARHFEINSCGAFQLTYYVHGLEQMYTPGREIAVYLDTDDLIDQVRFYLNNATICEQIAECGLQRTLADHTFSKRFKTIFKLMNLDKS